MVTYDDIEKAHQRISDHIHNTPILTSDSLDNELGSNLFFKCENFQKTGSFKIRGATNSILQLNDKEIKNGIITTSSGNHGAAVAFIANKIGASSKIIMPNNTPKNKIENVERYGGEIFYCEPNIKSREYTLEKMVQKFGIKDNIKFVGYVTQSQKENLLAESNALLFPSLIEGFGHLGRHLPLLRSLLRPSAWRGNQECHA